ncbi:hypothetical protein RCL1_001367 [Eukaryota sp. TZLM3-RCL]
MSPPLPLNQQELVDSLCISMQSFSTLLENCLVSLDTLNLRIQRLENAVERGTKPHSLSILKPSRKPRVPWTQKERDFIISNSLYYGKWRKLLTLGHGIFHPSRTNVSVKDAARVLIRKGLIS